MFIRITAKFKLIAVIQLYHVFIFPRKRRLTQKYKQKTSLPPAPVV